MKICYRPKKFSAERSAVIDKANEIIGDYQGQGFDLTLRQLYYQFVSRDLIKNNFQEYKRLGDIINDGRLAGLISWKAIVDRTRNVETPATWSSPASVLEAAASCYASDWWKDQPVYVEVWIEKDALVGVIEGVCERFQVPHFSCRGYTSQSEMWEAAQRLSRKRKNGGRQEKDVVILHLGDHDPSGIDMTRDIESRLNEFSNSAHIQVERIALNMRQVDEYSPPPNFAKATDARFEDYRAKFGEDCWELDALEPSVISDLIEYHLNEVIVMDDFEAAQQRDAESKKRLREIAADFNN